MCICAPCYVIKVNVGIYSTLTKVQYGLHQPDLTNRTEFMLPHRSAATAPVSVAQSASWHAP